MIIRPSLRVVLFAPLVLFLGVQVASATTIFNITDDVLNDVTPGSYGTVTVTQNGTSVVNVLVQLSGGLEFVDTGVHNAFTFNLSGNPTIPASAITNLTSGFGISNPLVGGSNPPFGTFMYAITLPNGGDDRHGSTLAFTLTLPGLTESSFIANESNYFFAADTWNQGDTLARGAKAPGTFTETAAPVPEPASLLLVGSGLVVMRQRRRARKNASAYSS